MPPVAYSRGDVFAAIGSGLIRHFSPTGVLLDTLTVPSLPSFVTGMFFDTRNHLFATLFSSGPGNNQIAEFDDVGNFVGYFASSYAAWHFPESIVGDSAGDFYVGQASTPTAPGVPANAHILKFDSAGTFLDEFIVATETRGSDWIEIKVGGDQCVVYYTSEGNLVKKYNVCSDVQLADFATFPSPHGAGYALRILPNGDVLVATGAYNVFGGPTNPLSKVFHIDSSGTTIFTYTFTFSNLFALNIDPDGRSFWTADLSNGAIYHINFVTHTLITSWVASPRVAGLAIFGERRSGFIPQFYRRNGL